MLYSIFMCINLKFLYLNALFHCLVENRFLQNETAVARNFVRVFAPLFLCESGGWTRRVL